MVLARSRWERLLETVSIGVQSLGRVAGWLPAASHYALLAVLLFMGLELMTVFHRWIVFFVAVFLSLLAGGIVLVRVEEGGKFRPIQAILPVLAALGIVGFGLFLPISASRHVYFLLASLLFYWLLRHGARHAYPTWNWLISTIVLLLNLSVVLGLRGQFYVPVLLTLLLAFAVIWLISLQALRRVVEQKSRLLLLTTVLGLVLTELVWVLLFLPLHFIVLAGLVVVAYYVAFHMLSLSLEGRLTIKGVFEYLVIGIVAVAVLLLGARWQ